MIPSSRRISESAWRPVSSTVIRASRSRCWSGVSSRRTALAWTVITLTECASTSCSSRVIRFRSSSTARRASSSVRRARSSASRACSECLAAAAEITKMPMSGKLSQISSVHGTSGARMKTVQPATRIAPSAVTARRQSRSEPAAQQREQERQEHRVRVVGGARIEQREDEGARGDDERRDERCAAAEEQRSGGDEGDRGHAACGCLRRSSRCRSG